MSLGLLGMFATPVMATPVFSIREITFDSRWQEDRLRNVYSLFTSENIHWLASETKLRIYDGEPLNFLATLDNEMAFPTLLPALDFNWRVSDAVKYRLDEIDTCYQILVASNWRMTLETGVNLRFPKVGLSFYRQIRQGIATELRFKSFKYYLNINYQDKKDEASANTHQTVQLHQSVFWDGGRYGDLELFWNEKTGNYPDYLRKNGWSQEWGLKGRHDWPHDSELYWCFTTQRSTRGYSIPGNDQTYQVGYERPLSAHSRIAVDCDIKNHEAFQIAPELFDPDEIITDTEKSYRDARLALTCHFLAGHISWKIGYAIERKEFYQREESCTDSSEYFTALTWTGRRFAVSARFAREGTAAAEPMIYQFGIKYKL